MPKFVCAEGASKSAGERFLRLVTKVVLTLATWTRSRFVACVLQNVPFKSSVTAEQRHMGEAAGFSGTLQFGRVGTSGLHYGSVSNHESSRAQRTLDEWLDRRRRASCIFDVQLLRFPSELQFGFLSGPPGFRNAEEKQPGFSFMSCLCNLGRRNHTPES